VELDKTGLLKLVRTGGTKVLRRPLSFEELKFFEIGQGALIGISSGDGPENNQGPSFDLSTEVVHSFRQDLDRYDRIGLSPAG
jgi:hypothetical protein